MLNTETGLDGEYVPSPVARVRKQVADYETSGGVEGATLEEVVRSQHPAAFGRFVSKPAMQAAYQRFQSEPMRNNQQAVQLFAAVNLALWLRQSAMSMKLGPQPSALSHQQSHTLLGVTIR